MRHLPEVIAEAAARAPRVAVTCRPGTARWNVIDPLPASGNIGIELGVAAGSFSARMMQSGRFARFYGVDAYSDGHSAREYKAALLATGLASDYRLLRLAFAQAVDLFPDASFDFIYVDGFAHGGLEGGRTLADWYPKLKPGGIMAGDDYDAKYWPLVVWAVHEAAAQLGTGLEVTDLVQDATYNRFPSWSFTRPGDGPETLTFSPELQAIADAERARIDEIRRQKRLQQRRARHR
ncbi:class I SAM-dependent methyltransferase [Tabrizicola soli]|uniref:Class I SAM-dependent methyltransferase n=1 Tax=Tabrizicola soli TaxID=2185115 RepID=A0ABV7E2E9_9RHOB|nr:class I SAM-dependent methyltransferase [Tabrizicola soli]